MPHHFFSLMFCPLAEIFHKEKVQSWVCGHRPEVGEWMEAGLGEGFPKFRIEICFFRWLMKCQVDETALHQKQAELKEKLAAVFSLLSFKLKCFLQDSFTG